MKTTVLWNYPWPKNSGLQVCACFIKLAKLEGKCLLERIQTALLWKEVLFGANEERKGEWNMKLDKRTEAKLNYNSHVILSDSFAGC